MSTGNSLRFSIQHPNGEVEELTVDSDSVVVGCSAHCEIRLPQEECNIEQLQVETRGGGVFAEARSMDPPTLLNGMPFTQGRLLSDSVLMIGSLQITVECVEVADRPVVTNAKKERTNPVVLVAALVGFPVGFYMLLSMRPDDEALSVPPAPPALWDSKDNLRCLHTDGKVAEAQAASDYERASSRRERSPFSPEDGVEAVSLFQRSASCFDVAQKPRDAARARNASQVLQEQVSRQFHVHQVRLERALAGQNYESAHVEARILHAYLGKQGGAYGSWLSDLQRGIEVKFGGKK